MTFVNAAFEKNLFFQKDLFLSNRFLLQKNPFVSKNSFSFRGREKNRNIILKQTVNPAAPNRSEGGAPSG